MVQYTIPQAVNLGTLTYPVTFTQTSDVTNGIIRIDEDRYQLIMDEQQLVTPNTAIFPSSEYLRTVPIYRRTQAFITPVALGLLPYRYKMNGRHGRTGLSGNDPNLNSSGTVDFTDLTTGFSLVRMGIDQGPLAQVEERISVLKTALPVIGGYRQLWNEWEVATIEWLISRIGYPFAFQKSDDTFVLTPDGNIPYLGNVTVIGSEIVIHLVDSAGNEVPNGVATSSERDDQRVAYTGKAYNFTRAENQETNMRETTPNNPENVGFFVTNPGRNDSDGVVQPSNVGRIPPTDPIVTSIVRTVNVQIQFETLSHTIIPVDTIVTTDGDGTTTKTEFQGQDSLTGRMLNISPAVDPRILYEGGVRILLGNFDMFRITEADIISANEWEVEITRKTGET